MVPAVLDNCIGEKIVPYIQFKPLPTNLRPFPLTEEVIFCSVLLSAFRKATCPWIQCRLVQISTPWPGTCGTSAVQCPWDRHRWEQRCPVAPCAADATGAAAEEQTGLCGGGRAGGAGWDGGRAGPVGNLQTKAAAPGAGRGRAAGAAPPAPPCGGSAPAQPRGAAAAPSISVAPAPSSPPARPGALASGSVTAALSAAGASAPSQHREPGAAAAAGLAGLAGLPKHAEPWARAADTPSSAGASRTRRPRLTCEFPPVGTGGGGPRRERGMLWE